MKTETGSTSRLNGRYFSELAASLLDSPEISARAGLLVDAVCRALPGSACVLYSMQQLAEEAAWVAIGVSAEVSMADPTVPARAALFAPPAGIAAADGLLRERSIAPGLRPYPRPAHHPLDRVFAPAAGAGAGGSRGGSAVHCHSRRPGRGNDC